MVFMGLLSVTVCRQFFLRKAQVKSMDFIMQRNQATHDKTKLVQIGALSKTLHSMRKDIDLNCMMCRRDAIKVRNKKYQNGFRLQVINFEVDDFVGTIARIRTKYGHKL